MAASGCDWLCFSNRFRGRAMAVRGFPAIACRSQLVLRNTTLSLLCSIRFRLHALYLLAARAQLDGVLAQNGAGPGGGGDYDAPRLGLGSRHAKVAAVTLWNM